MKRALLLAGLLALAACSQAPVPPADRADLSAQRLSTSADDRALEVAAHPGSGAVYALTDAYAADGASSDVFLRRYARSGSVVWTQKLGTETYDGGNALATDAGGNLIVSYNDRLEKRRAGGGVVWSRTVQNVSALTTDKSGNVYVGSNDGSGTLLLSKYTAAGSRVWTRGVEGRGIFIVPTGLATDAGGNVYVAATDYDDCCLWNGVLKYSPGGQQLFSREVRAGGGDVELKDVAVVGNALYLAGELHSSWEFNPDVPDDVDGLLVKLSLGGAEGWRKVFGTPETEAVNSLAADASGLYLTGSTFGNLGGVQPGGSDVFLRKFGASGGTLWTKQIGSSGDDAGDAVVAYSSGELYLAGEAGGALQGGTHRGGQDAFLRRTDGSGNRVWTDQ